MDDKSLKKIIAKVEYEKGKTFLQSIEKQPKTYFKPYAIAASILILFGLFFIWNILDSNRINSQDLYAENFNIYPNIVAPITRNASAKTMQERAFHSYESKDYYNALIIFDSLLIESKSDKHIVNFYKANIYLETQDSTAKAISLFKSNLERSHPWKDKNLWYLSLAYLKNNEPEEALKVLERLAKSNSTFKQQQRLKLLNQLKTK